MYDGVQLQNLAQHEFKNDPKHDLRFTQPYSEKNAVGFMLVTAGYYKSNLCSEKPPIPDVRAELADGSTVFVETAEVIESDSARLEGMMHYVNVGIRKAFDTEPTLGEKLKGYDLGIRVWMTESGDYDRSGILHEFLTFLRTTDFSALALDKFGPFPKQYVALASIDAKFLVREASYWSVPQFYAHAHSYAPESLASQVITMLDQKRGKRYEGSPLWLALYMTDMLGVPQHSLEVLHGVPLDFSPFEKLFIGDQRSVLVYTPQ